MNNYKKNYYLLDLDLFDICHHFEQQIEKLSIKLIISIARITLSISIYMKYIIKKKWIIMQKRSHLIDFDLFRICC